MKKFEILNPIVAQVATTDLDIVKSRISKNLYHFFIIFSIPKIQKNNTKTQYLWTITKEKNRTLRSNVRKSIIQVQD